MVLVGLGMGARVAVHMMSKTPGDDGKALPEISNDLLKSVKGMVAINYHCCEWDLARFDVSPCWH